VLAECYGYSTGEWQVATASLRHIYGDATSIWAAVNDVARRQLQLDDISADAVEYLDAVLGSSAA
jgi:hypothetical protein